MICHVILYEAALLLTCLLGDFLPSTVSGNHGNLWRALIDSLTHGGVAFFSWAVLVQARNMRGLWESLICGLLGMAIDSDHFIAARSLSLQASITPCLIVYNYFWLSVSQSYITLYDSVQNIFSILHLKSLFWGHVTSVSSKKKNYLLFSPIWIKSNRWSSLTIIWSNINFLSGWNILFYWFFVFIWLITKYCSVPLKFRIRISDTDLTIKLSLFILGCVVSEVATFPPLIDLDPGPLCPPLPDRPHPQQGVDQASVRHVFSGLDVTPCQGRIKTGPLVPSPWIHPRYSVQYLCHSNLFNATGYDVCVTDMSCGFHELECSQTAGQRSKTW